MELPTADDVVRRLPAAAARLAGVPGSGPQLNAAESRQVVDMLRTIETAFESDSPSADAFLTESMRLALLHLVAFAMRVSRRSGAALLGLAAWALQAVAASESLTRTPWRARALFDFSRKLLRMDTLQCCSAAIAEDVVAMTAAGEGDKEGAGAAVGTPIAAGAPAAGVHPPPYNATPRLNRMLQVVTVTLRYLDRLSDSAFSAGASASEQLQQLRRELAAALRGSCLPEHCARWALHMQLAEAAGRVPDGTTRQPLVWVTSLLCSALLLSDSTDDKATKALLNQVLTTPCVQHLDLSMGLAALCAADGGPSYGLPPALLLRLPILNGWNDVRRAHGRQQPHREAFFRMLRVLRSCSAASPSPPHDWRAAERILRRVGTLAVASARVQAAGEAELSEAGPEAGPAAGARGAQPAPLQLVLGKADVLAVALAVLEQLRDLVGDQPGAAPAALAEAAAASWRLAADVASSCLQWATSRELESLAHLLCLRGGPQPADGLLPAAAPRAAAAAVAGGLLPLWERLLRCSGRDPGGPEATLVRTMMVDPANADGLWDLMAYGEERHAAALVATWAKLLRTLAGPELLLSFWDTRRAEAPLGLLACALAGFAGAVLGAACARLEAAGRRLPAGAAASAASAPQRQLARLLAYAVGALLPPLAHNVHFILEIWGPAQQTRRPDLGGPPREDPACVEANATRVVQWLPMLALLSQPSIGQHTEAAAAATAGGAAAAAATTPDAEAAAGWRSLLLHEVSAVPLLGSWCKHNLTVEGVEGRHVPDKAWRDLATGCCCVAAACPDEVREAVLAAATEAAAAAAVVVGGGGGGRGVGRGADGRRRCGGRGLAARGSGADPGSGAETIELPGWSPQALAHIARKLQARQGGAGEALAGAAAALARQAARWAAGGGEECGELAAAVAALGLAPPDAAMTAGDAGPRFSIPSSAEALSMLRTCANPACENLAGDSEAALPLRACGRCGGAWYCRRECQQAHWQSGHKAACVVPGRAAAGAAGPK